MRRIVGIPPAVQGRKELSELLQPPLVRLSRRPVMFRQVIDVNAVPPEVAPHERKEPLRAEIQGADVETGTDPLPGLDGRRGGQEPGAEQERLPRIGPESPPGAPAGAAHAIPHAAGLRGGPIA